MEDKIVELIYAYLVNYVSDDKVEQLSHDLIGYIINGSYIDYQNDEHLEDLDEFLRKELEEC